MARNLVLMLPEFIGQFELAVAKSILPTITQQPLLVVDLTWEDLKQLGSTVVKVYTLL